MGSRPDSFNVDALADQARLVVDLSNASLADAEVAKLKSRVVSRRRWAFSEDRFDLAKSLNETAKQLGKPDDKQWMKSGDEWASLLDAGEGAFELVKEALQRLEESPDDADANLTLGRYHCLLKGEWEKGLPYLKKGNDERLRTLAERELSATLSRTEALGLADSWWDFVLRGELTNLAKQNTQFHAAHVYRWALPDLSGLSKVRVEERLAELEMENIDRSAPFAAASGPVVHTAGGIVVQEVQSAGMDSAVSASWVGIGIPTQGPSFGKAVTDLRIEFTAVNGSRLEGTYSGIAFTRDAPGDRDVNPFSGTLAKGRIQWSGEERITSGTLESRVLLLDHQHGPYFSELWLIPESDLVDRDLMSGII